MKYLLLEIWLTKIVVALNYNLCDQSSAAFNLYVELE